MCYPHKTLIKAIAKGCTCTPDAYSNMYNVLLPYSKKELCHLAGIGFAGFLVENCDLKISCPVLIIVGEHDKTGKVWKYCDEWHKNTGFPLALIPNAAHNANYDNSEKVNQEIEKFLNSREY